MVGTRHKSAPKRQIPEWMIKDNRYLRDTSDPNKDPKWFVLVKKFEYPQPARRFADVMEANYHKAKLIEVVDEHTKKPKEYRVYIRDLRK
jgi:hypothetical protein